MRVSPHARVEGTNDSSILSKVSMATAGYVQDQLLAHFTCEAQSQWRRSPLINRGYYVKAKAVDYVLTRFLEQTRAEPRTQMVSLGAGFDTAYFRLKSEARLGRAVVFEVDFPAVARRKAALIRQSPELLALLSPGQVWFHEAESGDETPRPDDPPLPKGLCMSSADYCLLGVDVTRLRELEESLVGTGLDPAAPTLLLSECVLTYVDANRASALIGWAAERLVAATFVAYEQAHPGDVFGSVMMNHFSRLRSPLRALRRFPTRHAQHARYLSQGWERCESVDMNEFYLNVLPVEERARVEHLELFDEHEEWHLKCSHYFILVASKGRLSSEPVLPPPFSSSPSASSGFVSSEEERELPVLSLSPCEAALALPPSYGHCSCTLGLPACRAALLTLADVWLAHLGGGAGNASSSLALSEVPCIGAAPSPRWRHAACVVSCRGRRFLFVYGGRDTQHLVLSDWHILDLEAFTWTQCGVEGPVLLHGHSAVERWDSGGGCGGGGDGKDHESHIFIVGGGGNCFSFCTHLNPCPLILRLPQTSKTTLRMQR
ncbi:tRNA wybutosine-synthesizing protein 4 [Lampetra fluviatilis]